MRKLEGKPLRRGSRSESRASEGRLRLVEGCVTMGWRLKGTGAEVATCGFSPAVVRLVGLVVSMMFGSTMSPDVASSRPARPARANPLSAAP